MIDPRTNGNLDTCRYCGGPLRVTGGTDPGDATNGFAEAYECESCDAKGAFESTDSGDERFYGACKNGTLRVEAGP